MDKKEYFELMAEDVKLENLDRINYLQELRRAQIVVDLLDVSEGQPRVLDVGCGQGLQLSIVAKKNPKARLVGLDISEKRLARARSRVPGMEGVCADIEADLPLAPESFDRVICSEVMEHLAEPGALLVRLRKLVKPCGVLVISVPYRQKIKWVRCTHCGRLTSEHIHSFDEEKMGLMLRDAGLRLKRTFCPRLYWLHRTAFLPYMPWRIVHRMLEITMLRKVKPLYMFCLAGRQERP